MGGPILLLRKHIAFALALLILSGCAHDRSKTPSFHSEEESRSFHSRENELGRQIHQAILTSFRVYSEPRVVGYVTRMGNTLAKKASRKDLHYQFTVLYDDRLYATSAPGGFVYVTTGFINFCRNEAELSAVLAHEIAWLQTPDPRLSKKRKVADILTKTGVVAAPFLGPIGSLAALGLVLTSAFVESKSTIEVRLQKSDRQALRYMSQTGEDPQGYLDMMGRLLNPSPEWSPYLYDYSQSHPLTMKRFQVAMKEFEKLPIEGKSYSVHRERYMEITRGVREIYQR